MSTQPGGGVNVNPPGPALAFALPSSRSPIVSAPPLRARLLMRGSVSKKR
jgi:hypothetical protein